MIRKILDKIIYGNRSDSKSYEKYLRKKGISIGNDIRFFDSKTTLIDIQNPFLIEIGNNVKITKGVIILTHDYSWSVLSCVYNEVLGSIGNVKIGNNVFIGMNTIILKNTYIQDNVIIGAGSVVSGILESNSVYAGNPAKKIMSLDEYYNKVKNRQIEDTYSIIKKYYEKNNLDKDFDLENKEFLKEYEILFVKDKSSMSNQLKNIIYRTGNGENIFLNIKENGKYNSIKEFVKSVKED